MCENCREAFNEIPTELYDAANTLGKLLVGHVNKMMETIPTYIIEHVGEFPETSDDDLLKELGFVPSSEQRMRWKRIYIAQMLAMMAARSAYPVASYTDPDQIKATTAMIDAVTINSGTNRGHQFGMLKTAVDQMNKTAH